MRISILFAPASAVFLALTACQTQPPVTAGTDAAAASNVAAPSDATAAPAPARDGFVSPVNDRTREREAAWAAAVRGLDFSSGLVVVESPPRADDVAAARRFMDQAEADVANNRRTEAVAAYAAAVRAAPDDPATYLGLASAMSNKGKTDLARAAYRTALELDPENIAAHADFAGTFARETRWAEAIAAMNEALLLDPAYGPAHERLAIWHYYAGDDALAWEHVQPARDAGYAVPPQFLALLEARTAEAGK